MHILRNAAPGRALQAQEARLHTAWGEAAEMGGNHETNSRTTLLCTPHCPVKTQHRQHKHQRPGSSHSANRNFLC